MLLLLHFPAACGIVAAEKRRRAMEGIFTALRQQQEKGNDTVLCTITASAGSTPRGAGSQMLVGREGLLWGTIGGGSAELRSLELCQALLRERHGARRSFAMHPNGGGDIGMVCGGDVEVDFRFIPAADPLWREIAAGALERMAAGRGGALILGAGAALLDENGAALAGTPEPGAYRLPLCIRERAVIFGGGHIALALAPLLAGVGFRVTVLDDRPDFAVRERFPAAEAVLRCDYGRIAETVDITPEDYVAVMTNGHLGDFEVQRQALPRHPAYIGVIGSRRKTAFVNEKLRQAGIAQADIDRVHTPIGMAIRAVTPAEIAVSIAGEMILARALQRDEGGGAACPMHTQES